MDHELSSTPSINILTGSFTWTETSLAEVSRENTSLPTHILTEDALKNAELSGGEQLRTSIENECHITRLM
jgi:hypothetical protein